jgi:hypothetical protein
MIPLILLILYLMLSRLFPLKEDTMNEGFWEPGVYDINQRAGPAGASVFLQKIIVHDEACAIFYNMDPNTQYNSLLIRKDKKKIDFPEGFYGRVPFITIGYCSLPSPPLDLYFGRTQTCMNLFSTIVYPGHFRLKTCELHKEASEVTCRSIPIESFFYPDDDGKRIYISRIITGQFTPTCSYTVIKGDFHEIESVLFGAEAFFKGEKGPRTFYLMCKSGDDTTKIYSFRYNPYIKALESIPRFIPPEDSIIGFRLQTYEEASHSNSKISIMSDPPIPPGKPFEMKSYAKSWLPWKNPKPATMYEAIRYRDLQAIKSLLRNNGSLLNNKNVEGYTPLHVAAAYGSRKIVAYLISQGADINAENNAGFTPLDFAADNDIIDLLRKHGARKKSIKTSRQHT